MNGVEQVAYETRVRMRYAVIAFLAALLSVGSQLIELSGPHTSVNELTLDLITANKRFPIDLIGAVIESLGVIALLITLAWLHDIARARNPDVRGWIRWLIVVGAGGVAVMTVLNAIVIAIKSHQFATTGDQSFLQANAINTEAIIVAPQLIAQLSLFLLTGGFIWTALNGLRVGLLTRPLGYMGVVAGVLVLFPLGPFATFIQAFWLVGVSVMYSGRWPNGSPPAWEQGTAVPWVALGQPRGKAQPDRVRHRRARLADVQAATQRPGKSAATAAATATEAPEDAAATRTRASTPKRKRKHRN